MSLFGKNPKINTVPAWTQADLDAAIAAGQVPAGTLLSGFVLSTDWNSLIPVTGSLDPSQLTTSGSVPLSTGSTAQIIFDPEFNPTAVGSSISQIDSVGSVAGSAVATGSARPLMGTLYGRRVIDFQGNQELNLASQSIDPRNFTMVFVTDLSNFTAGSGNAQNVLAGFGGTTTRSYYYNGPSVTGFDPVAGTTIGYGGTFNAGTFNIVTIVGNGTNVICRCNGIELFTSPANGASPNYSNIRLGRAENLVQSMIGKIAYFELYNSALDATTRASNETRIRSMIPVKALSLSYPRIFYFGNSLLEGRANSSRESRIAEQSMAISNLANKDNFLNRSYAGITTAQMNSAYGPLLTQYMGTGSNSYVIVWEISNDINIGTAPATAYSNLTTLCGNIKSQAPNTKIIVMTMLPRGSNTTVESSRITVNSSVMAGTTLIPGQTYGYTKGTDSIDYVFNVAGISAVGAPGSQNNTTYYSSDTVHLLDAGNALISLDLSRLINFYDR